MKHLRQWTNELNITGRVLVNIFILMEGKKDNIKVRCNDLVCEFLLLL